MHEHHHHDAMTHSHSQESNWKSWTPLYIVFAYIIASTIITLQLTEYTSSNALSFSMGFFFLYFSLFKLLDIKGFIAGYLEYDIISKRIPAWATLVPFIELGLGIAYLLRYEAVLLHLFTLFFSVIIMIGVAEKLSKKEMIHCACLGTVLKVPLTWISLLEYTLMAIMAVAMILLPTSLESDKDMHQHTDKSLFQQYAVLQGDDYDSTYLHEMVEHHQGAVDMATLVKERSKRPELTRFAESIFSAQQKEIAQMEKWQTEWSYLPTIHEHTMHDDMHDMYEELRNVKESDFDSRFLELMIEHHESAIEMSVNGASNAKHQELKDMTESIVLAQSHEVHQMHEWLHEWGFDSGSTD